MKSKEVNNLVKNTIILSIGGISTKILAFLLLPIYTNILTTAEYGVYDYVVAVAAFIAPIFSLLISESMFRFLIDAKNENDRSTIITHSLIIAIIGSILLTVGSAAFFSIVKVSYAIPLVLYCLSTIASWQIAAIIRGLGNIKLYTIINLMISILTIVFNIITIVILHMGANGLFVSYIFANILCSVVFAIYIKIWKHISFKSVNKKDLLELIKYSMPLVPNKLSWAIVDLSDRIIILNILGMGSTGVFSIAHKFPSLINTFYSFFYTAWSESSARVINDDCNNSNIFYNNIYETMKKILFSVVVLMLAGMMLAFRVMIGKDYQDAYVYVPFLAYGMLYSNLSGVFGGIFTAHKDTKSLANSTILAAAINLITHFFLIKFIGLYAAAVSTLVANLIIFFVRSYQVKKYTIFKRDVKLDIFMIFVGVINIGLFYSNNMMYSFINIVLMLFVAIMLNRIVIKNAIILFKGKMRRK